MSHGVEQVSDSVLEALRLVRHYNVAKLRVIKVQALMAPATSQNSSCSTRQGEFCARVCEVLHAAACTSSDFAVSLRNCWASTSKTSRVLSSFHWTTLTLLVGLSASNRCASQVGLDTTLTWTLLGMLASQPLGSDVLRGYLGYSRHAVTYHLEYLNETAKVKSLNAISSQTT